MMTSYSQPHHATPSWLCVITISGTGLSPSSESSPRSSPHSSSGSLSACSSGTSWPRPSAPRMTTLSGACRKHSTGASDDGGCWRRSSDTTRTSSVSRSSTIPSSCSRLSRVLAIRENSCTSPTLRASISKTIMARTAQQYSLKHQNLISSPGLQKFSKFGM